MGKNSVNNKKRNSLVLRWLRIPTIFIASIILYLQGMVFREESVRWLIESMKGSRRMMNKKRIEIDMMMVALIGVLISFLAIGYAVAIAPDTCYDSEEITPKDINPCWVGLNEDGAVCSNATVSEAELRKIK